jgi:hypothetical protein
MHLSTKDARNSTVATSLYQRLPRPMGSRISHGTRMDAANKKT